MKKFALLVVMLALVLALVGCSQESPLAPTASNEATSETAGLKHDRHGMGDRDEIVTYEITLENLTPATGQGASQPFAPAVLATHSKKHVIFKKGRYASDALAQIAEDAVSGPLLDSLAASRHVYASMAGDSVVLPGDQTSFMIDADKDAKRLSLVFMLVNTNDAFGGLNSVRLPKRGQKSFMVRAWDAGTEQNTELTSDIPGPCCGSPMMGMDEHRRVRRHRGITGEGDLDPEIYGWDSRVARVTVRRVN